MSNKTLITQLYGILLEAQLDLDNLVKKELRGGRFLPDSLIAQLAEEHARVYDEKTGACFFVLTETGWKFYTSEESVSANKHDAAQRKWDRGVRKLHNLEKSKRGGARKTEAKPKWQTLGDAFNELSRTEKNAFLKYVGEK